MSISRPRSDNRLPKEKKKTNGIIRRVLTGLIRPQRKTAKPGRFARRPAEPAVAAACWLFAGEVF